MLFPSSNSFTCSIKACLFASGGLFLLGNLLAFFHASLLSSVIFKTSNAFESDDAIGFGLVLRVSNDGDFFVTVLGPLGATSRMPPVTHCVF